MKKNLRKSVFSDVGNSCYLSKTGDFIEVTEWTNGEGFDVTISDRSSFIMTWGEFKLLKKLVKMLNKYEDEQK
jgi:hypothetical protein